MKIERVGLTGRVVIDSRGIPANDPRKAATDNTTSTSGNSQSF